MHASLPMASYYFSSALMTLNLSFWIASITFSISDESMTELAS